MGGKNITIPWDQFKNLLAKKEYTPQHVETTNAYEIFFNDGPFTYITYIFKPGEENYVEGAYNEWVTSYLPLSNIRIEPKTVKGKTLTVSEPREGEEVIVSTHNFCDRCTWYGDSVRVTGEELTPVEETSGKYLSAHTHWIDMISGRVQDDLNVAFEQKIANPENPHGYAVKVYVNAVEVEIREPLETSGGVCEILWEEGCVQFFTPLDPSDVVTVDYSYATTSTFYLSPFPESKFLVEAAEADFSTDVIMTDGIEYAVWGYVGAFAPEYSYQRKEGLTFTEDSVTVTGEGFDSTWVGKYLRKESDTPYAYMVVASVESESSLTLAAPYSGSSGSDVTAALATHPTGVMPFHTKIELKKLVYKRMVNILQEGIGSYPVIQKVGSSSEEREASLTTFRNTSRGVRTDFQAIPFRYATTRTLDSAFGLEVRVRTSHDRCFGGEAAFLTFYGTVVN